MLYVTRRRLYFENVAIDTRFCGAIRVPDRGIIRRIHAVCVNPPDADFRYQIRIADRDTVDGAETWFFEDYANAHYLSKVYSSELAVGLTASILTPDGNDFFVSDCFGGEILSCLGIPYGDPWEDSSNGRKYLFVELEAIAGAGFPQDLTFDILLGIRPLLTS